MDAVRSLPILNGELIIPGLSGIWKSDGTKAGTVLLRALVQPVNLIRLGKWVFFTSLTQNLSGLWKTDGTSAGTVPVSTQLFPRNNLAVLNNKLLFFAVDRQSVQGLWISDGSAAGTTHLIKISTLNSTANDTSSRNVFFSAFDSKRLPRLWVTNGTAAGTKVVQDLNPASTSIAMSQPTLLNGNILFTRSAFGSGSELWTFDPGATAQHLDRGCATTGFTPTQVADDPVLGGTTNLSGEHAPGNSGILLLSTRAGTTLQLPMGCRTSLAPGNLMALSTFTVKNGNWMLPLFIPNQTNLIGLKLVTQAFLPTTTSPLGFELSNGLLLSLGN